MPYIEYVIFANLALLLTIAATAHAVEAPASLHIGPSAVKIRNNLSHECTGTFISNTGHLLTAFHCFDTYHLQGVNFAFDHVGNGLISHVVSMDPGATAEVNIEGLGKVVGNIVLAGRGTIVFSPSGRFLLDEKEVATIRAFHDDFLIVKLPAIPARYSCAQTRADELRDGDDVVHAGYPIIEPSGRSAEPNFAKGKFSGDPPLAVCAQYSNRSLLEQLGRELDHSKFGFSSGLTQPGYSGGGTFDDQGRLAGVSSLGGGTSSCPATAFVLASHIHALSIQELGADRTREIFACSQE